MRGPAGRRRALLLASALGLVLVTAPVAHALWRVSGTASVDVTVATSQTGYLKANGQADSTATGTLEIGAVVPRASTLPNYDTDRDAAPGLLLAKGSGLTENDPTKRQLWSIQGPVQLNGAVTVRLWSAMKDFDTTKSGSVSVGLYRCDPPPHFTGCTLLADSTITSTGSWSGGSSTWVPRTWSFGTLDIDIPPNRRLFLKVVVNSGSGDDMWFAYDTAAQPSALVVG